MEVTRVIYSSLTSLDSFLVAFFRYFLPLRIRSRVRFTCWDLFILAYCLFFFVQCPTDRCLGLDLYIFDIVLDQDGGLLCVLEVGFLNVAGFVLFTLVRK